MYEPTWLGRPIIQFPTDIVAIQELLWQIQPEVVVETGVAHGGSLLLSASILELLGRGRGMADMVPLDSLAQGIALDFHAADRVGPDLRILARVQGRDKF